ncbi:LamG domain-containing protein [Actinocrispum wychmicini]|uniref:N,N-dimethylformamidase n=1 Tax=Actinocrispum wychmicini TaxID=1213861 RepID=A0A4R2JV40_9PSEU|nr:LamG domain-containing protein [Actinocrispum wychmicini]TCO61156.1 N,N-dimethylformamidase [Actinocrispum wychmicini]
MTGGPALLGYVDPLSVAAGAEIRLMVSATTGYDVELLRLVHGSADPRGPGVREVVVDLPIESRPAGVQPLASGSYLSAPAHPALDVDEFTVTAWIMPTMTGGPRAIIARRENQRGWALGLTGDHRLAAWAGAADQPLISTDTPVPVGRWTFVAATFSPRGVTVVQVPVPEWPVGSWRASATGAGAIGTASAGIRPLVAAWWSDGMATAGFTGRIDRPAIYAGAADESVLAGAPDMLDLPVLARWRPGRGTQGVTVVDDGPHALTAEAVNTPARGVPGANWTGREIDFRLAPDEYDAIHFHDDDLTDARWEPQVTLRLPDDLRSGVYAFRLRAGREQLSVPFFVRPPSGTTSTRVAVLIPTFTYLAYANSHLTLEKAGPGFATTEQHRWAARHKVCSLYDLHRDGTGCYYASRRRPLTTLTPDYAGPFGLWNLSADLCLIDWLEHEGIGHDVVCDDDLHTEGVAALAGYDVVLTGSHPEYYTAPMLAAHEAYLAGGGRVMYLGGNGYYWVTGVSPDQPYVIEIRRGHTGTRGWEVPPGETHLSTTGEPGGLWRHRGRAPQRHVGVGFAAQGGRGDGRPYKPLADAERGLFALSGVDGLISVDGLVSHAAAGMEIDRADPALGTPPHAVVLATADGFSDFFQLAIEDVLTSNSKQGGTVEPRVRADLVFFEYPNGGGVFSTGSIAWCTALGVDSYANPVARVTGNVLRRFLDPTPLDQEPW